MTLAAVLRGPRAIGLRQIDLPDLAEDEVLIKVDACAVCATDIDEWARGEARTAGITGHEIAGTVLETGSAVGGVRPHERVCIEPNLAVCCGHCRYCEAGIPFSCVKRRSIPCWGFAEAMAVREQATVRVPRGVPSEVATLAEPLACVVHALRLSETAGNWIIGQADVVAVVGAGTLGLLAVIALRRAGANRVVVVARREHQRAAARRLGAEVLDENLLALRHTRPSLVLVAAGGGDQMLDAALSALDVGGELVVLGLLREPQTLDARRAVLRNNRVAFSSSYSGRGGESDMAAALAIIAAEPAAFAFMLRERLALADIETAFAIASDPSKPTFRVLVLPGAPTNRPVYS